MFDIVASLLEILDRGACNKTTLAGKANLATRSSTKYINLILRFNLVTKDESANCFQMTDKGREFLKEYKKIKAVLSE